MSNLETLSLWDRLFNRYKQEILLTDRERWSVKDDFGRELYHYYRDVTWYKITDRITGSEKRKKEYHN